MLPEELERYQKQITLEKVGIEGQNRLKESRILVVGAGGLGCPALMQLAASGVGIIGIVDGDTVELSNLPRQTLFTASEVGQKKAVVAANRLKQMNPHVSVTPYTDFLDASNAHELLAPYGIVIDATDQAAPRYEIANHCEKAGIAHIYGAVQGMSGQTAVFNVQDGKSRTYSYTDLFPEPLPFACNCAEAGILGMVPGSVGVMQALEAVKLLLGQRSPLQSQLLLINYETHVQNLIALSPSPRSGKAYQLKPSPAPLQTISIAHLNQLLQSSTPPLLIDVRNKTESKDGHIGGLWIPLNTLLEQAPELSIGLLTVVYCQTGRRSALAAQRLKGLFPESDIRCLEQAGASQKAIANDVTHVSL